MNKKHSCNIGRQRQAFSKQRLVVMHPSKTHMGIIFGHHPGGFYRQAFARQYNITPSSLDHVLATLGKPAYVDPQGVAQWHWHGDR